MHNFNKTKQLIENAILCGIDLKSIPEKNLIHILQNLHNINYLDNVLRRLELLCFKKSEKVGARGNRYMSKFPSGKWVPFAKQTKKYNWKSYKKLATNSIKREKAKRDAERLAKKTLGIEGNEKNIGDILDKELKRLLKHNSKIKILKSDFKSLTYEAQINYIDSYNAIILHINSIDDLLNDLFNKQNKLTFNEEQDKLFKTVENLNKLFLNTPFEGAFAKTIEFVRESWKDWSVRYFNLGNLFDFDIYSISYLGNQKH